MADDLIDESMRRETSDYMVKNPQQTADASALALQVGLIFLPSAYVVVPNIRID